MTFMTLYCYFWLIISVLKKPNIQSEDNNNNLMTQKISLNLLKSFYLEQHEEMSWAAVVEVSKENINSISIRVTCRLCNIPLCSIFNLWNMK